MFLRMCDGSNRTFSASALAILSCPLPAQTCNPRSPLVLFRGNAERDRNLQKNACGHGARARMNPPCPCLRPAFFPMANDRKGENDCSALKKILVSSLVFLPPHLPNPCGLPWDLFGVPHQPLAHSWVSGCARLLSDLP